MRQFFTTALLFIHLTISPSVAVAQLGDLFKGIESTLKKMGDSISQSVEDDKKHQQTEIQNESTEPKEKSKVKTPTTSKEWYEYLRGRWANGNKCLSNDNASDGVVYEVDSGLITAINHYQIENGQVVLRGMFFVRTKDTPDEIDYYGFIQNIKGQKVDIHSTSRIRYVDADSFSIKQQRIENNLVINEGRHLKTREEMILRRCDTPSANAAREEFQRAKIAAEQERAAQMEKEKRQRELEATRQAAERRKMQEQKLLEAEKLAEQRRKLEEQKQREAAEKRKRDASPLN